MSQRDQPPGLIPPTDWAAWWAALPQRVAMAEWEARARAKATPAPAQPAPAPFPVATCPVMTRSQVAQLGQGA